MVCKCEPIESLTYETITYKKYLEILKLLDEFEKKDILELYAGDSYLNDVEYHITEEDRYTINYYYRCKNCGKIFYLGFCCRGGFVFKIDEYPKEYAKTIEDVDFERTMSEKEKLGVRFNNMQRNR